jgi:hypothetical protein
MYSDVQKLPGLLNYLQDRVGNQMRSLVHSLRMNMRTGLIAQEDSQRGGESSGVSQDAGHEKLKKEADELKKQGDSRTVLFLSAIFCGKELVWCMKYRKVYSTEAGPGIDGK